MENLVLRNLIDKLNELKDRISKLEDNIYKKFENYSTGTGAYSTTFIAYEGGMTIHKIDNHLHETKEILQQKLDKIKDLDANLISSNVVNKVIFSDDRIDIYIEEVIEYLMNFTGYRIGCEMCYTVEFPIPTYIQDDKDKKKLRDEISSRFFGPNITIRLIKLHEGGLLSVTKY